MARPVNLNRYRKQRARATDKARADNNAAQHGRSGSEIEAARALIKKSRRDLDGHKQD
jgi:uncharacterized protein DUF4169